MKILFLIFLVYPIISIIPTDVLIEETKNELNSDSAKLLIQEKIFYEFNILPYIIILFGCFIILYGAYYNFFFIIQFTLFLYFLFSIFIKYNEVLTRNLLFVLLFSFISSVLLYIIYRSYTQFIENHIHIKKAFSGAMTGCFLVLIIFHFIHEFKDIYNQNIYYIVFPILIIIFGVTNAFIPTKFAFIPCSIISGLFFIQLSIDSLFGNNLSEIERILDIIFFIILAILTTIFQIYHLKRKEKEKPDILNPIKTYVKKNLDITMDNGQNSGEQKELEEKGRDSIKDNDEVDETQDNQINDQDD